MYPSFSTNASSFASSWKPGKRALASVAAVVLALAGWQAQAQGGTLPPGVTIYATEVGVSNNEIVKVVGSTVTPVTAAANPDSLIFTPSGNIVFTGNVSVPNMGTINVYNGSTTTVLATGLNSPQDIALIPAGFNADAGKVLVADTNNGRIVTQSLTGGPYTVFATGLTNSTTTLGVTGLTFDTANHLFAVNGKTLLEFNGAGTQIGSLTLPFGGDGITYDPVTGNLFVSTTGGVMKVPTSLAGETTFLMSGANVGDRVDGVESDGMGNLFMADTATAQIVQFNIATSTFTLETSVPTIDDLAPVVGPGSPPNTGGGGATPEPATITLLGISAAGMLGYGWRRRRQGRSH